MKEYWEIIRELREDRDLKQAEIAAVILREARIQRGEQVYSRYEKGINELPIRHLKTLCLYYNVSADYILGLSAKMQMK